LYLVVGGGDVGSGWVTVLVVVVVVGCGLESVKVWGGTAPTTTTTTTRHLLKDHCVLLQA